MTKVNPSSVLILGSGALKIGQGGEFDYSGSQALLAMREEGIRTILVNPNIATVQTTEGMADKIYFLPVTPYFVEQVIAKEHPEGILLSFGGQTALNCGVELERSGVLSKYGVKVLGTPVSTIEATEDRELFVEALDQIEVKTIKSEAAESLEDAVAAARRIGYPIIIRSAYALGGLGSGFCDNEEELIATATKAFSFSPQVLVEKSLKGWKEIEYEVVRDCRDRCLTICDMENFDPLGIHTGESIVVAPSRSLSKQELDYLHDLTIKIVKHLGIVGECNIQYAFSPDGTDYRVIEVNARLSRSSALASKATGYPLAFVAAKLALGYGLEEIKNNIPGATPAAIPPKVDYIVCKIPRWDLAKFKGVSREIGSSMKSVGEVMAIGRSFEEAIQKGLRMVGQGAAGFLCNRKYKFDDIDLALSRPTDLRIFAIAAALRKGYDLDRIYSLTKIDKWFLSKLLNIELTYRDILACGSLEKLPEELLKRAKCQGYSDWQIGNILRCSEKEVRSLRKSLGITPYIKRIETPVAACPDKTAYLYLSYNSDHSDIDPHTGNDTMIVLGSGAYRIGSSVEFDCCSVDAVKTIRKEGHDAVMINYNPETVSTDYDTCDRLYFDELTLERVLDICDAEQPSGVVASVGGQIPNNLALPLQEAGVHLLGTSADDIDRAEDRSKFSEVVDTLGIDQPRWKALTTYADVEAFTQEVGYPVLVRPSYVLSGAAMNVCHSSEQLRDFLDEASEVSEDHPVVISSFMQRCNEIECDAVADGGKLLVAAISEHIEFAGVHSGDATICFPTRNVSEKAKASIRKIAAAIAAELHICGPFNIQFLLSGDSLKVIECNLRASRSFPFVSKVMKCNLIELATRCMLGLKPEAPTVDTDMILHTGVKSAQFSFSRLGNADPVLGVDMASTGEAGCIGLTFPDALLKSMLSVGYKIPQKAVLISSGSEEQKHDLISACFLLAIRGIKIYATAGTAKYLQWSGVQCEKVLWPSDAPEPGVKTALDVIASHDVDLVINIPKNYTRHELTNGYRMRRAAIDYNIPLITDSRLADAFIRAFSNTKISEISILSSDCFKV